MRSLCRRVGTYFEVGRRLEVAVATFCVVAMIVAAIVGNGLATGSWSPLGAPFFDRTSSTGAGQVGYFALAMLGLSALIVVATVIVMLFRGRRLYRQRQETLHQSTVHVDVHSHRTGAGKAEADPVEATVNE